MTTILQQFQGRFAVLSSHSSSVVIHIGIDLIERQGCVLHGRCLNKASQCLCCDGFLGVTLLGSLLLQCEAHQSLVCLVGLLSAIRHTRRQRKTCSRLGRLEANEILEMGGCASPTDSLATNRPVSQTRRILGVCDGFSIHWSCVLHLSVLSH